MTEAPCTFGRRTDIPGMAKFDELSKLKVWNETVSKETRAWSDGLKKNPPSREFRVVRPDKSESRTQPTCSHLCSAELG